MGMEAMPTTLINGRVNQIRKDFIFQNSVTMSYCSMFLFQYEQLKLNSKCFKLCIRKCMKLNSDIMSKVAILKQFAQFQFQFNSMSYKNFHLYQSNYIWNFIFAESYLYKAYYTLWEISQILRFRHQFLGFWGFLEFFSTKVGNKKIM